MLQNIDDEVIAIDRAPADNQRSWMDIQSVSVKLKFYDHVFRQLIYIKSRKNV